MQKKLIVYLLLRKSKLRLTCVFKFLLRLLKSNKMISHVYNFVKWYNRWIFYVCKFAHLKCEKYGQKNR